MLDEIVKKKSGLNLENYFISQFEDIRAGDDGAVIGCDVYSKDAFFENVHFKTAWMSYYQIAKKAMLVNISDAIAMNAKPKYVLLSVALPKNTTKLQMKELACGFKDTAQKYGLKIIGGDTISNTKLDITVSVVSYAKKPVFRKGIKNGFLLGYTGKLGNSAKDLKKLLNLGTIHKKSKFVDFGLREDFMQKASRFLGAGMDISDGLFSDLDKLAKVNNIGFRFCLHMPKRVGCSGEEYEMLVAFDKRYKKAIYRRAEQSRTPLTIFATALRGRYKNRCKAHHFN